MLVKIKSEYFKELVKNIILLVIIVFVKLIIMGIGFNTLDSFSISLYLALFYYILGGCIYYAYKYLREEV